MKSIGFMQVHLRLYKSGGIYETTVINVFKERNSVETELISIEHKIVTDKARVDKYICRVWLDVTEPDMRFLLHIPIHQSNEWEVIVLDDTYTLGFYCMLGELGDGKA